MKNGKIVTSRGMSSPALKGLLLKDVDIDG